MFKNLLRRLGTITDSPGIFIEDSSSMTLLVSAVTLSSSDFVYSLLLFVFILFSYLSMLFVSLFTLFFLLLFLYFLSHFSVSRFLFLFMQIDSLPFVSQITHPLSISSSNYLVASCSFHALNFLRFAISLLGLNIRLQLLQFWPPFPVSPSLPSFRLRGQR